MNETLEEVLNKLYKNQKRVRIFYGDPQTGKDWCELHDTQGVVSRSTGKTPVYLLVNRNSSLGGGAILVDNIVKITVNKQAVYEVDTYQMPTFEIEGNPFTGFSVYRGNELFFTNKDRLKCENLVKFLQGERNRL